MHGAHSGMRQLTILKPRDASNLEDKCLHRQRCELQNSLTI